MPKQPKRWIEDMTIADLEARRHPENPKNHDVPGIAGSILRYGFVTPPEICERTGKIAAGHGRLDAICFLRDSADPEEAAKLREILDVNEDGDLVVPTVRGWASEDDLHMAEYLIADNEWTIVGGWDDPVLAGHLSKIMEARGTLEGIGFPDAFLTDLLARMSPPPSLDDLAGLHGDPNPADMWPSLRFSVPPELRDLYNDLRTRWMEGEEFDSVEAQETEMFRRLLAAAAARRPEPVE